MYEGGSAKEIFTILFFVCYIVKKCTWPPYSLSYCIETKIFKLFMARQVRWCTVLAVLKLSSPITSPIYPRIFFLVACVISRIIFKIRFSRFVSLSKLCVFLLRRSHIIIACDYREHTLTDSTPVCLEYNHTFPSSGAYK